MPVHSKLDYMAVPSLQETRPLLPVGGASVRMSIGGLHDLVIGPAACRHVRELVQFVGVSVHKVRIRCPAQHPVHNGSHLSTCDGVVGPEGAVCVTADPAVLDRAYHLVIEPVYLLMTPVFLPRLIA